MDDLGMAEAPGGMGRGRGAGRAAGGSAHCRPAPLAAPAAQPKLAASRPCPDARAGLGRGRPGSGAGGPPLGHRSMSCGRRWPGFDGCALRATATSLVFSRRRPGVPPGAGRPTCPAPPRTGPGVPFAGPAAALPGPDVRVRRAGPLRMALTMSLLPWRPPGDRKPAEQRGPALPALPAGGTSNCVQLLSSRFVHVRRLVPRAPCWPMATRAGAGRGMAGACVMPGAARSTTPGTRASLSVLHIQVHSGRQSAMRGLTCFCI